MTTSCGVTSSQTRQVALIERRYLVSGRLKIMSDSQRWREPGSRVVWTGDIALSMLAPCRVLGATPARGGSRPCPDHGDEGVISLAHHVNKSKSTCVLTVVDPNG